MRYLFGVDDNEMRLGFERAPLSDRRILQI